MTRDIHGLEKDKYTKDDEGRVAVRIVGTDGDNGGTEDMNIFGLDKEAFTTDDEGKIAIRVSGAGGAGSGGHIIEDMDGMEVPQRGRLEFTGAAVVSDDEANDTTVVTIPTLDPQGLTEITFAATDWQTNLNNQLLLNLLHNLNDDNINVAWYENGVDGSLEIPWESPSVNEIQGCIPNGKAFNGLVRITGRISGSTADNVQVFSFGINDWVRFGTSGQFIQAFVHNFETTNISWDIYDTNGSRVIMCPNTVNNPNSLAFAIFENERFAGKIYIRRG